MESTWQLLRRSLLAGLSVFCAIKCANGISAEVAFSRIVHGWTNYSSAFLATHDIVSSDNASVAAFFTPEIDVYPREFAGILISDLNAAEHVDFSHFSFVVGIWSGLETFTNAPGQPDVATFSFAGPTGGSVDRPDAITRAGRPAYELRFAITNRTVTLTSGHSYLVGLFVRGNSGAYGSIYLPTSNHTGDSDVQAGNTVINGWMNIADAPGSTIYSGELAMELLVDPVRPTLGATRDGNYITLFWPAEYENFILEVSTDPAGSDWTPVSERPSTSSGMNVVRIAIDGPIAMFRLRNQISE